VIFTAAFLLFALLTLFFVSLTEQMGEKHTTQAPTAQQAAGYQNAREPVRRFRHKFI
jgi:hypothetical protein